jgi:CheY-like chemotaxis protein
MFRTLRSFVPELEILTAKNGKEAIHLLHNLFTTNLKTPSIIFLDINMPVMDGFEFLDVYSLMDGPKDDIKIVMVTSSNHSADKARAQTAGVTDFVIKPVDEKMLSKFF